MKKVIFSKNPYLLFLPFLFLYTLFILLVQKGMLWGDESRHLYYAKNLLQGFYSPPTPKVSLDNGPGYPMVILPFLALHLPLLYLRLLNAILLYLSIVFLHKALVKFVPYKLALIFSIFWGCYYNSLDYLGAIYAEVVTVFLISGLILSLSNAFENTTKRKNIKALILSGFIIGLIALTKVIFGYVMLAMFGGIIILWLFNRKSTNYFKSFIILLFAFIVVSPYLIYTYTLTKKIFYWSTSGGNNHYWMSTPYAGEYGSWVPDLVLNRDSVLFNSNDLTNNAGILNIDHSSSTISNFENLIESHHQQNFDQALQYTGVARDSAYAAIAFANVKAHPLKFIQNCISNIGRIVFNYPYTYTLQKPGTLARLPLNGTIVLLMLFCIIPALKNWQEINFGVRFILFFALTYLGGSVFGSAETRMFTVIVPILLIFIAFILSKTIKLNINWRDNKVST